MERIHVQADEGSFQVIARPSPGGGIVAAGFSVMVAGLIWVCGTKFGDSALMRGLPACFVLSLGAVAVAACFRKERLTLDRAADRFEHRWSWSYDPVTVPLTGIAGPTVVSEPFGGAGSPEYRLRFTVQGREVDALAGHERQELEHVRHRVAAFLQKHRT